jgi:hypothetical protein
MAKVRFLQSAYVISLDQSVGFNDELDIEDEKVVSNLVENGLVDVLIEEKIEPKPTKKADKKVVKND